MEHIEKTSMFGKLTDEQLQGADYALRLLHITPRLKGGALDLVESLIQDTVDEMNARNKQPPKNCNCMAEAKTALEKEYGPIEFEDSTLGHRPGPIRFRYHPKNADGKRSAKWSKAIVPLNYCPICGLKYLEKK